MFKLIFVCNLVILAAASVTTNGCSNQIGCNQGRIPIRVTLTVKSNSSNSSDPVKTCPDDKTTCEDDETCCQLFSGGYGCCDPDHSRCCGDGVHCCPVERRTKKIVRIPLKKHPLTLNKTLRTNSINNSVCPGGSYECPTGNTCCKDDDGDWACCNLANAVCCSDGLHCCPSGFRCRLDIGRCVPGSKNISFV